MSEAVSKKKKRGRPREHKYLSIAKTLLEFEIKKKLFLNVKNRYTLLRMIVMTLNSAALPRWKVIGLEKGESGLGIEGDPGKQYLGNGLRDRKTGEYELGEDYVVDLDHDPPRLRLPLESGKTKDVPLKCPRCGEQIVRDLIENESWEDEYEISCPNGHFGPWRAKDVKQWLEEEGLLF